MFGIKVLLLDLGTVVFLFYGSIKTPFFTGFCVVGTVGTVYIPIVDCIDCNSREPTHEMQGNSKTREILVSGVCYGADLVSKNMQSLTA